MFKWFLNLFERKESNSVEKTKQNLLLVLENFNRPDVKRRDNARSLYNILNTSSLSPRRDLSLLREVDINSSFSTSSAACEFVLEVLDDRGNIPSIMYSKELHLMNRKYVYWRSNDYTIDSLMEIYKDYLLLWVLVNSVQKGNPTLDENQAFDKLTSGQIDFFSGSFAASHIKEIVEFFILMCDLTLGEV